MDDLISRQAASVELSTMLKECFPEEVDDEIIDAVHTTLQEIPISQQWHTEPPKESGFYIACSDLGVVGECVYTDDGEWDTDWNYRFPMWCQIVAWIPMPEPYPYQVQKWSKK